LEDCCGWNRKVWADAIEFAIAALPFDLHGKKVLEIGASDRSTIAPVFAAMGAQAFCSYYQKVAGFIENGQLKYVRAKYGLGDIPVFAANIAAIEGRFDVIVMKSVLGGVCRNEDYDAIRSIIGKLMKNNVAEGGVILTFDNGYIAPFRALRRRLGTGGHSWNYFESAKFARALSSFSHVTQGFGYLNVASATLQLGRNAEFVNTAVYYADRVIAALHAPEEHAVLSTIVFSNTSGSTNPAG